MDLIASPYVLLLISAFAFYAMGGIEARTSNINYGLPWALASLAVSLLVLLVLNGDWAWLLCGQVGLFLAIGVIRALRSD